MLLLAAICARTRLAGDARTYGRDVAVERGVALPDGVRRAAYLYASDQGLDPLSPAIVSQPLATIPEIAGDVLLLDHGDWHAWKPRNMAYNAMACAAITDAAKNVREYESGRAGGARQMGHWGIPSTRPKGFGTKRTLEMDDHMEAMALDFLSPTLAPIGLPPPDEYREHCEQVIRRAIRVSRPRGFEVIPCGADRTLGNTEAKPKATLTDAHVQAAIRACVDCGVERLAWWWPIKSRSPKQVASEVRAIEERIRIVAGYVKAPW